MAEPIRLVSACLAGMPCRYDGAARPHPDIVAAVDGGAAVPACPEMLGGLAAPRPPAEIVGGDGDDVLDGRARVRDAHGGDVTGEYLRGAHRMLAVARAAGATAAVLQERSPACGATLRYDGAFDGSVVPGAGVAAALLRRNGIAVTGTDGSRPRGC